MGLALIQISNSAEDVSPHSRDMFCPRFSVRFALSWKQRAQGKPGARRTRGLVRN